MHKSFPTHNASSNEISPAESSQRLSRRVFLAALATGLLSACASSSPSAPAAPTPSATPTQRIFVPTAPISLANVARLQRLAVLNPNAGRIRGLAWSPDGKTLAIGASASAGSSAQLWDVSSGRPVATLQGPSGQVYQMAWSPDGQLLAAGVDDNTARVWDTRNQRLVQTLQGTDIVIFCVAWSPRGEHLAAGNSDGSVQIWERATWRKLSTWKGPASSGQFTAGRYPTAAYTVAWSPDSRLLAATRYDGYVRIWDASTGKLLHLLATSNQPNAVSWSPDGHLLASASDDGTIQLWDTASFKTIRTLNAEPEGGWAFAIPWSPAGRLLACTRDGHIAQVWDVQAGRQLKVLDGQRESIWTAGWSPDNLRIATGSDDGTVCLWGVR